MIKEYSIKSITRANSLKSVVATLADDRTIIIGNGTVNKLLVDTDMGFRDLVFQAPSGGVKLISEGNLEKHKVGDPMYAWNTDTKKSEKTDKVYESEGLHVPRDTFPVLKTTDTFNPMQISTKEYRPLKDSAGAVSTTDVVVE